MPKMTSLLSVIDAIAQTTAPAEPQQRPGPAGLFGGIGPIILFIAAMYFLMIAPQRKKQKEHEKMLSALGTGDEVITAGGIFGTITNVKEDRFVLRVGDNQKLEVGKAFIQTLVKKSS